MSGGEVGSCSMREMVSVEMYGLRATGGLNGWKAVVCIGGDSLDKTECCWIWGESRRNGDGEEKRPMGERWNQ